MIWISFIRLILHCREFFVFILIFFLLFFTLCLFIFILLFFIVLLKNILPNASSIRLLTSTILEIHWAKNSFPCCKAGTIAFLGVKSWSCGTWNTFPRCSNPTAWEYCLFWYIRITDWQQVRLSMVLWFSGSTFSANYSFV